MMENRMITTKVVDVTPDLARQWLETVPEWQRKVYPSVVGDYAKEMDMGKWLLTGETLVFDENNQMINGQHRLKAVVECGKTIPMLVVFGVERKAFQKMDSGKVRTFADHYGVKERRVAAISSVLAKVFYSARPDHEEIWVVHEAFAPELGIVSSQIEKRLNKFTSACIFAGAVYVLATGGDRDFVMNLLRPLVRQEFSSCPEEAEAFIRFKMRVYSGTHNRKEEFLRAVMMLDTRIGTPGRVSDEKLANLWNTVRENIKNIIEDRTGVTVNMYNTHKLLYPSAVKKRFAEARGS